MTDRLEIKWYCSDGYGGKNRPQVAFLPEYYLLDCETLDDVEDVVENIVKQDFVDKVSYHYDESQVSKVYQRWQELKDEQADTDEEHEYL